MSSGRNPRHFSRLPSFKTRSSTLSASSDMNLTSERSKFLRVCTVNNAEFFLVVDFPSIGYLINYFFICVVSVLLTFSTIFLNALTVLAYSRSPQLQKKTSYFLVMLLALNDLAVGTVCNTTFTIFLLTDLLGYKNCSLFSAFLLSMYCLSGVSFASVFMLNVERYLSIIHPIFHRNKATKRSLLKATLVVWFIFGMQVCIYVSNIKIGRTITSITIVLSLIILMFMYVKIFLRGRGNTVRPTSANSDASRKGFLRNIKQAKSCLIVLGCTFLSFLPLGITGFLEKNLFVIMVMWYWSGTLVLMGSTLNSVIFFWRNQTLRNEAKKIIHQTFLKKVFKSLS